MWRHSRISTDAAFFVLRLVHDKTERLESPEKTDTENHRQETPRRVGRNGLHDARYRAWNTYQQALGRDAKLRLYRRPPRHFVCVQVKSTVYELGTGYVCAIKGGHKPYPPGSFDFLAAYVVLENSWYIIPRKKSGVRAA